MSSGAAFKPVQNVVAPPPIDPSIAENQAEQVALKKRQQATTNFTSAGGVTGKATTSARTLLGA